MSRQIAIAMWLAGVALLLVTLVLMIQNAQADPGPVIFQLFALFESGVILSIGAVIALRRPANPIGWIFILIALQQSGFAREYGRFALVTSPGALPGAVWVAMWWAVAGRAFGFLPVLAILLFPTGRLPSKRWRPVLLLAVASALGFALRVFSPTVLRNFGIANPLGVPGFGDMVEPGGPGGLPSILFVTFTAVAVVQRLRRATGAERQQLKWLIAGASSFLVALLLTAVSTLPGIAGRPEVAAAVNALYVVSSVTIALAMAVAILRYRLYDIDALINRTLVYAALTATLAVTFVGGLVLLQQVLRPLTAGGDLAVAISTLATFALLQPIRRRAQELVDRRFDRSRYDAARTIDSFADRLRDQVDLDAVRSDLVGAVHHTMSPTHASLWLRERAR
jgi:hypothetical protein